MLDLGKLTQQNLFEVKWVDGEVYKLKRPSQAFLIRLMGLGEEIQTLTEAEVLPLFVHITTAVLNSNTEGRVFEAQEVADSLSVEVCQVLIENYIENTSEQLGE